MKFYKDWMSYDYENLTINEYPPRNAIRCNLGQAIGNQAGLIATHVENPIIFVSGGIDSQAVAWGFSAFRNIDIKYVYICPVFIDKHGDKHICKEELFFAQTFARRYRINLEIVETVYDRNSLERFLIDRNFWETPTGAGTIFQLPVIEREREIGYPVTADGHFVFKREGNMCSGVFKKPGLGLSDGIKLENQILFDFYAPYMFKFYQDRHERCEELQYHRKIEAKNLIYTDMGYTFRPKLSGWEFLLGPLGISIKDLTTVDWANDHSWAVRQHLPRGPEVIGKILDLPREVINKKLKLQFSSDQDRYVKLYEFEKTF